MFLVHKEQLENIIRKKMFKLLYRERKKELK